MMSVLIGSQPIFSDGLIPQILNSSMVKTRQCYTLGMYPYATTYVDEHDDGHYRHISIKCKRKLAAVVRPNHTTDPLQNLSNQINMCSNIGGSIVRNRNSLRCKVNKDPYRWSTQRRKWYWSRH